MRSSSIKSLVAVSSIVLTLSLAVPRAEARSVRPAPGGTRSSFQRAVSQLLNRVFGISANGGLPGDPIPVASTETTTTELAPKGRTR